jgi:putative ABC transport system permease protein
MTPLRAHFDRAVPGLTRTPGFTAAIVLTLGMGIGVGISVLGMIRGGLTFPASCIDPLLCGPDQPDDFLPPWTAARQLLPEVQAESLHTLLWMALGLALLVLGIVLVNVLTFVLARSAARRAGIAMRATLGASPGRLAGKALVEGLLMILAGTALGILVGIGGSIALRISWPLDEPPWHGSLLHGRVLALVAGVLAAAALLSWIAPTGVAWSPNLRRFLGTGARATAGPGEVWLRQSLVLIHVAATLVLVVSAGLLLRSFVASAGGEEGSGFDPRRTLTAQVDTPDPGAGLEQRAHYFEELLRRVRLAPGVLDSSLATNGAWAGVGPTDRVTTLCLECGIGVLPVQLSRGPTRIHAVSPGFFAALRLPVRGGREFEAVDRSGAPRVAVVSWAFRVEFFPNGEPLGKEVQIGGRDGDWYTIVGVVDDVTAEGLGSGATAVPSIYLSLLQHPPHSAALAVRTEGDPTLLEPVVEGIAASVRPGARVTNASTMERLLARYRAPLGWFGKLVGGLAVAVVLFATFGLYSVISNNVARRRREIGIRIALGAESHTVIKMVLRQSLRLACLGGVLGFVPLSGLARLLQATFRGVDLWEPALYGGVAGLIATIALVASYRPARGAASVHPQIALRED